MFYTPSPGGLCPAFENSGRGSSRVHFCLQTPAVSIDFLVTHVDT